MWEKMSQVLILSLKGVLGVFVVIGVIRRSVLLLSRLTRKKQKPQDNEHNQ